MKDHEAQSSPRRLLVEKLGAPIRLDAFLRRQLGVGHAAARRLLAGRCVRVDGRGVDEKSKGMFLSMGMVVEVQAIEAGGLFSVVPEPGMDLVVLAEGEGWVAVDKPAGVAVHPLRPGERGTMLNAAVARWPGMADVGEGGLRGGVVHRLDVQTSGAVLFATEQSRWEALRSAFKMHTAHKVYRAIVRGDLAGEGREIMDLIVGRHRPAKVRIAAEPGAASRRCDLNWRAVERFGDTATLVEVELGTGFLHQIRVMMAAMGHPVLGDAVYAAPGADDSALCAGRQMLHAARINAAGAAAQSPDPPDFAAVLKRLRESF